MNISRTNISDVLLLEPKVIKDDRGYFMESFHLSKLESFIGKKLRFCQDNESKSTYGVLRGLHYQLPPFAQTKLVRVISGKVLDVAVDIRRNSPTFGKHVSIELSGENKKQLFIPKGFAHGFVVLSEECILSYKVDNYYNVESDSGILYNDESLNIDWLISEKDVKLSEKDKKQPVLKI